MPLRRALFVSAGTHELPCAIVVSPPSVHPFSLTSFGRRLKLEGHPPELPCLPASTDVEIEIFAITRVCPTWCV